ncbi:MAG: hypothetical protein RBR08_11355 [Desulforegulaceae bacterium]|nr:hypothetical protein [Desulforegulaceae bacterium]
MDFDKILEVLKKNYPLGLILRKDIEKATGGLLRCSTLAVRDSEGNGINNRVYIGKNPAYKIEDVVEYLKKKVRD